MADLLVCDLHAKLVRAISAQQGAHFEGLGAAARHLGRQGLVDSRMKRKLLALEAASNVTRHITVVSGDLLVANLADMLARGQGKNTTVEAGVKAHWMMGRGL